MKNNGNYGIVKIKNNRSYTSVHDFEKVNYILAEL